MNSANMKKWCVINSENIIKTIFIITGLILFVIHGLDEQIDFTIDQTSLVIIFLALTPYAFGMMRKLSYYLDTLKVGNIEASFRQLGFSEQVYTFLTALAADRKLTFYSERNAEAGLGTAGEYLLKEMFENNKRRTNSTIRQWLDADEENLKWFAAEVIGYFELTSLAANLDHFYLHLKKEDEWSEWQLNCLWAHSKLMNNYDELNKFIYETTNNSNVEWLLDIYTQMPESGELLPDPKESILLLKKLIDKEGMTIELKENIEAKILILYEHTNDDKNHDSQEASAINKTDRV